ncbi:endonuclease/exonuclease/phosphatase family protein [Edaphocola flava]|uniref:endonuclease/exonuclease/phosphatase family protein n=1 Tax=Edaphocola flava TaxID=2499629 RepID=UPI00100B0314|nr:endonuclease [Edaphocola flava]
MKKAALSLLICLGMTHTDYAQKKDYQISAVAFYNLENLFDTEDDPKKFDEEFTPTGANHYTEAIYAKKLQNMSRVLSEIATEKIPEGPALIGVAEIENKRVLQDLLQQPKLKDRGWKIVHFESPDARGVDVGMLYNPRLFKVLDAEALFVDIKENGKQQYTRDILHVTGILGGDTVTVFVNHWPSRSGGEAASAWKRQKAASVCKAIIDKKVAENPNARVILMGDLNDDPVSPSVAEIIGAGGDKDKIKPGGMYNPWMSFFKKGIGTLGYGDSWNLFDQIILSYGLINKKNAGWSFYKAEIFKPAYLISNFGRYKGYPHRSFSNGVWIDGYADHFPTYIYLIKEVQP